LNFTGTVLLSLKIELPSALIGCSIPDQLNVTATWNVFVVALPARSVAVQLTVVVPSANVEPEAFEHTGAIAPSTASLADVVNVATPPAAELAVIARLLGTVSTGGVVSATVTAKLAVLVLFAASCAVHATAVVPTANKLPDAGVHATGTVPLTSSTANAA
jgi:hypothetical protein